LTICKWVSDSKLTEAFFLGGVRSDSLNILDLQHSLPHTLVVLQQIHQNPYNYKNICKLALQRLSRTDLQQHDNKSIKYLTLAATYIDDREHKKILDLQMMICNTTEEKESPNFSANKQEIKLN